MGVPCLHPGKNTPRATESQWHQALVTQPWHPGRSVWWIPIIREFI